MIPTYAIKNGRRYTYYKCEKDSGRAISTCPIRAIASREIDRPIWNELGRILKTPTFHEVLTAVKPELVGATEETLGNLPDFIESLYPIERNRIVHALVKSITLYQDGLDIVFLTNGAKNIAQEMRGNV